MASLAQCLKLRLTSSFRRSLRKRALVRWPFHRLRHSEEKDALLQVFLAELRQNCRLKQHKNKNKFYQIFTRKNKSSQSYSYNKLVQLTIFDHFRFLFWVRIEDFRLGDAQLCERFVTRSIFVGTKKNMTKNIILKITLHYMLRQKIKLICPAHLPTRHVHVQKITSN